MLLFRFWANHNAFALTRIQYYHTSDYQSWHNSGDGDWVNIQHKSWEKFEFYLRFWKKNLLYVLHTDIIVQAPLLTPQKKGSTVSTATPLAALVQLDTLNTTFNLVTRIQLTKHLYKKYSIQHSFQPSEYEKPILNPLTMSKNVLDFFKVNFTRMYSLKFYLTTRSLSQEFSSYPCHRHD